MGSTCSVVPPNNANGQTCQATCVAGASVVGFFHCVGGYYRGKSWCLDALPEHIAVTALYGVFRIELEQIGYTPMPTLCEDMFTNDMKDALARALNVPTSHFQIFKCAAATARRLQTS